MRLARGGATRGGANGARAVLAALCLGLSVSSMTQAAPVDVPLPAGEELLRDQETPLATLLLPTGPVEGDRVPSDALEGRIYRRSWRVNGTWSTLQVLAPIRSALEGQGFEETYACTARACGGFAFRFGIEVIPAPDMAVHLSDFEFLSARNPESGAAVSVLVSRIGGSVYVQVLERHDPDAPLRPPASPDQPDAEQPGAETAAAGAGEAGDVSSFLADAIKKAGVLSTGAVADLLLLQGHAPLLDLEFASGSTAMGEGPFDTLRQLAAFLQENASASVLLVGHTDTVGGLDANIDLSRRRAASVRERLVSGYDIDADRIEVAGAGYMAPLAPNTTAPGREINRRVEVVLVTP
ncbi:OmpA family protein [Phaeobacter sp. B1627]|uniref:OmpA family protein n=1 Tax=Phaeobacter sp. B1627 TaxID=2583809 RepID=UPI00111A7F00|nr:OmpA family protein [Phaeobacter sp. B1627]TNJ47538.1 OmpA family protein [Phaeobacter sp. B1627]